MRTAIIIAALTVIPPAGHAQTTSPPTAPATAAQAPATAGTEGTMPVAGLHPGDEIIQVKYACNEGGPLDVVFLNTAGGSSIAVVDGTDGLIPMPQAVSASGAIYAAEMDGRKLELLTKGPEANLVETVEGKESWLRRDCTAPG